MDFITQLPLYQVKATIWVVVDRLTKYAHFIVVPPHFIATSLAWVFIKEIYRLHGMPKTIVSDRDRIFASRFWPELFKLNDTTFCLSSAYHPQSDGQTEVTNRILETVLCCYVNDIPKQWVLYLPLAEHWYNSSFQSAIKMTLFKDLYGRALPTIQTYIKGSTTVATLDDALIARHHILAVLKTNLQQAQLCMRNQANSHRRDREFQVRDWAWFAYCHIDITQCVGLVFPSSVRDFFGLFPISKHIGPVAYELSLPPEARIHPVFHVSKLKVFYGKLHSTLPTLDSSVVGTMVPLQPLNLHGARSVHTKRGKVQQLLVH